MLCIYKVHMVVVSFAIAEAWRLRKASSIYFSFVSRFKGLVNKVLSALWKVDSILKSGYFSLKNNGVYFKICIFLPLAGKLKYRSRIICLKLFQCKIYIIKYFLNKHGERIRWWSSRSNWLKFEQKFKVIQCSRERRDVQFCKSKSILFFKNHIRLYFELELNSCSFNLSIGHNYILSEFEIVLINAITFIKHG